MAAESEQSAREAAEAERGVLGALLLDSAKAWPQVKDVLTAAHFARHDHRILFTTIASVIEDIGVADSLVVLHELHGLGQLETVGGQEYIAQLVDDCPSAVNAGAYARLVRASAGRAEVIDIGTKLQARARRGEAPTDAARLLAEEAERLRRDFGDAAPEKPRPERRPMRWASLQGDFPPPRTWTISHWLTAGPTLMAGQGGVGKSLLAQTIGTALALGKSFVDDVHEPSTVLIWACEDDHDELWRRQVAICKFFDVPISALEGRLILEPRLGRENTLYDLAFGAPVWTSLRDELREQVNDYGARTLFLDNIGQTYGGKENDRHHVTAFLNGLVGLSPGISAVVMGHPAKSADSEFSGSTAWENAVRMRWYMGYRLPDQEPEEGAVDDPDVRYLAKRKTNYSAKDFRKLNYRDGLFLPDIPGPGDGFAARYGGADRAKGATECILFALGRLAEAHIRTTDGKSSPDYLPKKMREMKLSGDYAPKELGSALSQLRLKGKVIEAEVGKYANRAPKIGLVLVP